MLNAKPATRSTESRKRDVKRQRIVLTLGQYRWHLSRNEALGLAKQLVAATK